MTHKLYADFALAHDPPKYRLCRGDLVRLVECHISPSGEEGYSAEVFGGKWTDIGSHRSSGGIARIPPGR